ncbi:MAG: hypothetical protein AMJ72_06305 [Acidithiobacillales bacterium SM1_46]|nr:MAG: hypothetical protein AMJ72_06305 [Acidithiobacillales bacterium SM1_46]
MTKQTGKIIFDPDAWDKDTAMLNCCEVGVWIRLVCAMWLHDRSGLISGTAEQLARAARCTAVELTEALRTLQRQNVAVVTERNGILTVLSPRMRREAGQRKSARARLERHKAQRQKNVPETPKKRGENARETSDNVVTTNQSKDRLAHVSSNQPKCPTGNGSILRARAREAPDLSRFAETLLPCEPSVVSRRDKLLRFLSEKMRPNATEAKTLALAVRHLVERIQLRGEPVTLLDEALAWAKAAVVGKQPHGNVRNPKALFVKKTGYTGFNGEVKKLME